MTWYIKGTKNGISLYYAGENEVVGIGDRKDKWVCAGTSEEDQKVSFSSETEATSKLNDLDVSSAVSVVDE